MRLVKSMMSTTLPGTVIFPRLFVAAVLVVDSMRGFASDTHVVASIVDNFSMSNSTVVKAICGIQMALGILIGIGLFTRLASVAAIALWVAGLMASGVRAEALKAANASDMVLLSLGVVSVCLLLFFRGAGLWSVDASMSRPLK